MRTVIFCTLFALSASNIVTGVPVQDRGEIALHADDDFTPTRPQLAARTAPPRPPRAQQPPPRVQPAGQDHLPEEPFLAGPPHPPAGQNPPAAQNVPPRPPRAQQPPPRVQPAGQNPLPDEPFLAGPDINKDLPPRPRPGPSNSGPGPASPAGPSNQRPANPGLDPAKWDQSNWPLNSFTNDGDGSLLSEDSSIGKDDKNAQGAPGRTRIQRLVDAVNPPAPGPTYAQVVPGQSLPEPHPPSDDEAPPPPPKDNSGEGGE